MSPAQIAREDNALAHGTELAPALVFSHHGEFAMESTSLGMNRTGAAMSADGTRAMLDASAELTPMETIDVGLMKASRMQYIAEADTVGSIPPPTSVKGVVKSGVAKLKGGNPSILLDKMAERLAFERSGTRLYDALITKYEALSGNGRGLPDVVDVIREDKDGKVALHVKGENAAQTLARIRNEELAHFKLLSEAITGMGGDPTCQTPCADVMGTASMGFMQALTDPRTTLAQCLNVMVGVELTDNAGWELLSQLADEAGQGDLAGKFLGALAEEQEHVLIVRSWLENLMTDAVGTKAV
jgi:hypothetical protein